MGGELSASACSRRCRSPRATRHSAQNIAFHEVGRQAVMADPDWRDGRYLIEGTQPAPRPGGGAHGARTSPICRTRRCTASSAASCRTATTPTFSLRRRFPGRELSAPSGHRRFVERFDANSYLYLTRAMDYFDLAADYGGVLANAFTRHPDALLRRSRSPATGCSRPSRVARHRARAERRRRARVASPRSRPTRATTPSCSTSRNCSPSCAASSMPPRRRAACTRSVDRC